MNAGFDHHREAFRLHGPLRLVCPSSLIVDLSGGPTEIDLSSVIHVCRRTKAASGSSQRRAYVVLLGGARFTIGMPTMRFLSLEQLEDGFVTPIRVTAKALARISIRDECSFDTKTIELIA